MGKYAKRDLMTVRPIRGNTILKYGFRTNVKDTIRTELGQVKFDGNNSANYTGLVIGANAPKPPVATKTEVAGSAVNVYSSYCDISKVGRLPSGWSVGRGKIRRRAKGPKSVCVYVTVNGIKYAWMQPLDTHNNVKAQLGALGIKLGSLNDKDLVFGAEFPKPPRVGKILSGGRGGIDSISTYCDPSKTDSLPAGWRTLRDDGIEI
ncbi:hypothetical protein H6F90_08165 [Trichocoleus sp. FACHB-591]|uniref:hypothetical protein n=1 Tax=Trichocoleus sp. FACHB-591 TaxID=2692872 RepID=UPI0016843C5B|nr:hypothetical protein [Trichocoleus sp. FACHB-591]MBD2095128.1 hypothetical protein [Trichocoleus sp. FACHB-591]